MRSSLKHILFYLLFWLLPVGAFGQNGTWDTPGKASKKVKGIISKEKNKVKKFKEHVQQWGLDSNYKHGLLLGGKLNTNGWSGTIYYQTRKSPSTSSIWQLSFSEIKHDKQIKQEPSKTDFPQFGKPTPYIFGKINNLYTLQLGYGREHILLPNVVEDNLTVGFRWTAGISIAMLKPYYLRLVYEKAPPLDTTYMLEERNTTANTELFLNSQYILGACKWSKGLGEIQYIPGGFAELAFTIEPAKNKSIIQVVTFGINGTIYSSALPIMANKPAGLWQACLFVELVIGKRWK